MAFTFSAKFATKSSSFFNSFFKNKKWKIVPKNLKKAILVFKN